MACVTALKRGLDLENYGHPYEHSPKRHCSSSRNSFSPKANNLNLESLSLDRNDGANSPTKKSSNSSEFPALSQIPSNKILEQVTSEARNLKRRRELPSQKGMKRAPLTPPESKSPGRGGQISGQDSDSDDSIESVNSRLYRRITAAAGATSNQQTTNQSTSKSSGGGDKSPKTCKSPEAKKTPFSNPDQELRLTLRNVAKICESLLRQREDSIREEYDKILHEKLQEQYEIWCRYNQDQLSRHASSSSSNYIS